ncbi:hypothetical protein A4G20_00115 [Pasteurellaceae bacterium RH1A]|nr:hypothetical protein A4G20_00115 [Pasteurellaceae bacterium RH1A]
MKHLTKIAGLSLAAVLLTGCLNASSHNVDARPEVQPQPPVVQKAPAQPVKEYTLSGDFLFDFDKSNLTAKGKSVVSNMAKEIKAAGASRVTVTGYTDRLGSAQYNLKLSQARANTVKAYLQQQGVKANITAKGRGKANQVKACNGVTGQALKDCLKPNRRVHVRAE